MQHPRRVNSNTKAIGIDPSNIADAATRQAFVAAQQNIDTLFNRQQNAFPQEEAFDYQPGNRNEFDRIWRKLRDLEKGGGTSSSGGMNIATVTSLPAITGKRIVFLNSATDDVGQTGFWHTWPGATQWYPMSRLTSGDGLEGME